MCFYRRLSTPLIRQEPGISCLNAIRNRDLQESIVFQSKLGICKAKGRAG